MPATSTPAAAAAAAAPAAVGGEQDVGVLHKSNNDSALSLSALQYRQPQTQLSDHQSEPFSDTFTSTVKTFLLTQAFTEH